MRPPHRRLPATDPPHPSRTPVALLALLGLAWLAAPPTIRAARAEDPHFADFQEVIETAKRRVYPALVFVKPVQEDLSEGEVKRVEVLGSGVIFRPEGYLVTNHHVAEKAREIRVVLGDRRQVDAKVVGLDKATDLAVLKLQLPAGETVPFANFGDSDRLEEGQFVLALGSPYGFERSISLGIVSNAKRHLEGDDALYNNWIQTDAAINPGNSGGPLVNTSGEVIGINTLGFRAADNLGFAIPARVVRRVVERLIEHGSVKRSRHGLTLRSLVDYIQNTFFEGEDGVIVDDVAPGSAAEAAGLRKGDRILEIAGRPVRGKHREDLPEIRWRLADLPAGEPTKIAYLRDGERREADLVPEEDLGATGDGVECDRWDATFQRITRDETPDLHFWKPKGVYVLGVSFPGNAANSGLRSEDIVQRVDGEAVEDLAAVQRVYDRVIAEERPDKKVLFEVLRDGYTKYIALDYAADFDREK